MPDSREPIVLAYGEGTFEYLIGRSVLKAARLLGLRGETSKLLDDVLVRLCEARGEQLALAFGATFTAGCRPSGGAIFDGDLADALGWTIENGLAAQDEVDALLARAGSDLAAAALTMRAIGGTRPALNS